MFVAASGLLAVDLGLSKVVVSRLLSFHVLFIGRTHPSRDVIFFGQIFGTKNARNHFCT